MKLPRNMKAGYLLPTTLSIRNLTLGEIITPRKCSERCNIGITTWFGERKEQKKKKNILTENHIFRFFFFYKLQSVMRLQISRSLTTFCQVKINIRLRNIYNKLNCSNKTICAHNCVRNNKIFFLKYVQLCV